MYELKLSKDTKANKILQGDQPRQLKIINPTSRGWQPEMTKKPKTMVVITTL
jgi:hypothetical protein